MFPAETAIFFEFDLPLDGLFVLPGIVIYPVAGATLQLDEIFGKL